MDININESFLPHPEYTEYEISSFGRVYSTKTKRFLKINLDKDGYRYTFLTIEGKIKRCQVHRLMAETFIPNPTDKPMVCFKTSRKDVPKVKDLFWCDAAERTKNGYKRGFYPSRRKSPDSKRRVITEDLIGQITRLLYKGWSYGKISSELDVSFTVVYKVRYEKYGNTFDPLSQYQFEKQK